MRRLCAGISAIGFLGLLLSIVPLPKIRQGSSPGGPRGARVERLLVAEAEVTHPKKNWLVENVYNHTDRDKFTTVENADGTVSLKTIWGKYVTAELDGNLTAESDNNQAWEHFLQIKGPNGSVAFRSHHGKYITVRSDGSLAATRENRTDREFFVSVNNGDSTVSFFTCNGKFVTIETAIAATSEYFKMMNCPQGVAMRCFNGSFLVAHRKDGSITADGPDASSGCFAMTGHSNGKLSLKTDFGKYVTAQESGELVADGDRPEGLQQFRIVGNTFGTFSLVTAHGAYVDAAKVHVKKPAASAPISGNDTLPSLFCWSYSQTHGYEWETILLQRAHVYSIFSCNDWAVFTLEPGDLGSGATTTAIYGPPAQVGWQPGGQLILNTDLFLRVWGKIKEGTQFKKNQWTVKVDVDAVFFPDRLREHLRWKGNPWHNKVYFKNCQDFNSMQGPLEVYSRAAMDTFFEGMLRCKEWVHGNFGEDIFMQHCMPILGINFLVDWQMVADQYCHTLPYTCACDDNSAFWKAALHPCKSADTWLKCHQTSTAKARLKAK